MGSLYQRGEVWWIKYSDRKGKVIRESSESTKKMVAKRMLERREGEISEGKVPGIVFERVKFDELADEFIVDYQINNKKSLDRAQLSVKHLLSEFEGVRIPDITTPRIQAYVAKRMQWICCECQHSFPFNGARHCPACGRTKLKKGASNATINREMAALRRILNLGARQTPPKVNRVPYIPMLKENNTRKGFFEHADFIALRDALPDYLKPFVTFGYRVGWREQEVASLTWADVDRQNGIVTLKVGETKNDEARTVYLDDELREMFETLWQQRKKSGSLLPHVFLNRTGKGPIVEIKKSWDNACREVGIGYGYRATEDYVRKWESKLPAGPIFHDLRRTAVRNMVRSGIPERVAMMISGHKTRAVFDRYNIVNDADLKQAAKSQQAYLDGMESTRKSVIQAIDYRAEKTS
jgi:integrase